MARALKRKLALAVAVAAIAAGAAIAAVSATGQDTPASPGSAHVAKRRAARVLGAAASYLGIPATQLQSELQSGKTLAQIATATSGKSEAGLIQALLAARRTKLAKANANASKRVSVEVNRPFLGTPARRAAGRGMRAVRRYLGLSAARVRSELRSGQTLAQIANSTPGKSEDGLIEAVVTSRAKALQAAVSRGKLSKATESARLARLDQRVKAKLNSTHATPKSG